MSSEQAEGLTGADKEVLRELEVSLPEIVAACRRFDETDAEKLLKFTGAQRAWGATSPSGEFCESSWS